MEALNRREWPHTEAEVHLLRSAMFTAQAIIGDMERNGREMEIGANQPEYLLGRARIAIQFIEGLARVDGFGKQKPIYWPPRSGWIRIRK